MSTHLKPSQQKSSSDPANPSHLSAILASLLIALGVVFLLLNANVLSPSSSWWVIFLAIPGFGAFWAAYTSYQRERQVSALFVGEVVSGVVLLLLTIIFIFDPTWSSFNLSRIFPNVNWDKIWPFTLIVPGVVVAVLGIMRSRPGFMAFGGLLAALGGVFYFDVQWDYVWPFALIVAGLFVLFVRRSTDR